MERGLLANVLQNNIESTELKVLLFGEDVIRPQLINQDTMVLVELLQLQYLLCYYEWRYNGCPTGDCYRLKNVFKTFNNMYFGYAASFDLMLYILSECERDVQERGKSSFYARFFSRDSYFKYSRMYDICNRTTEYAFDWKRDVYDNLAHLTENALAVCRVQLDLEHEAFVLDGKHYPFGDFFMVEKGQFFDLFWFLEQTDRACAPNEIRLIYSQLGEGDSKKIITKRL